MWRAQCTRHVVNTRIVGDVRLCETPLHREPISVVQAEALPVMCEGSETTLHCHVLYRSRKRTGEMAR